MWRFSFVIKVLGVIGFLFALFFVFDPLIKEYGVKRSSILIPLSTSADRNLVSVKAYVGENSYLFVINTGTKLPCVIGREDLEGLQNRKEIGIQTWHQMNGKEFSSPKYLVDRIDLETVPITNTSYTINKEYQADMGEVGELGIPIFRQYKYWLFDFPKSRLYLVKDKRKFKKCFRLPFSHFISQSLEPEGPHITFKVDTEYNGPQN